ncbi:hypothetical protein [Vulgatibacter incomptus]|uniref:Uncharacterized protein n=1 Tax=Vulgatibacter incomptus TaxID=1391653 RepID=A0A0K1PBQ5_9BACT|nr:hypothetical protein [Vulgatibacter incomptus]AKU90554.1 hypothetical protein AKJ08_0941 [Vulgatibacter incomptus]
MALARAIPERGSFPASCPHCRQPMDLLHSAWCGCAASHPSKICPSCWKCACSHFDYENLLCWEDPPAELRRYGFERFFVPYAGRHVRR